MSNLDARHWTQIEDIYHRAVELPASEREAFLARACAGNDDVRDEIASLLRHGPPAGFLSRPAVLGGDSLADEQSLVGQVLGSYRIDGWLGAGGMGTVYRAHDLKLHRDVALKILSTELAHDTQRLARFRREAQLLASLNHPHVSQVFGFEEADHRQALVLELVAGPTLADRLAVGPLPLDEALGIATKIADALEAAHDQHVIHRDLKPSNIKAARDGSVKVLDFGLAKALEPSPILGANVTQTGVVVGTAAYMSPEQAKGLATDRRCDIWAFGCVLYEMITGRQAFPGSSAAESVAAVLEREPDWNALQAAAPPNVQRLVRRCLEKDTSRRLRDIGDARLEIEDALDVPSRARPSSARTRWVFASGALLAAVGVITVALLMRNSASPTAPQVVRLFLPLSEPPTSSTYGTRDLEISYDGTRIAYLSGDRLFVRRLDQQEPTAVDTRTAIDPFFSANGEWLGFFANTGLYKVPIAGGAPVQLVAATERFAGGTWRDGAIVFATSEGLFRVSENGGEVQPLLKPDAPRNERAFAWPHFTTDGRSLLFTVIPNNSADEPAIALLDLKTLVTKILLRGGTGARVVEDRFLVYASGQTLKAVAFDATSQRTRADSVSVPDVVLASSVGNSAAQFSVSATGTLVFMTPRESAQSLSTLSWVDRRGNEQPIALAPGRYIYPRVSPDGTRLALDIPDANRDIWIWDLRRQSLTRLTDGPTEDLLPIWSRDGNRVFFGSDRAGTFDVYSQAADGASPARAELAAPGAQMPVGLTPDGTRILVVEDFKSLGMIDLSRPHSIEPLLRGNFNYWLAAVSPDGKWLAYESDESGYQFEIFVRPFSDLKARREKISVDGGRYPLWGPKGSGELYYVDLNGAMMAASVSLSPTLAVGSVKKLFDWEKPSRGVSGRPYDVSPVDGRFLVTKSVLPTSSGGIDVSVVLNWQHELTRLMQER
jgi:serine/threonine protein kinase